MTATIVFKQCVEAIKQGSLIKRVSATDKEYHFQNWFKARLAGTGFNFDIGGRNSYPDFRMVATTEGYELKGLAYPGRDASFDSNSQVPAGFHNGRTVYYVFGRYPKKPDGNTYPVIDLVLCHGNFLNADHEYVHKNKSVKGFGSYGDILIRDRKMYVVPTPFHLVHGVAHQQTLILPDDTSTGDDFTTTSRTSSKRSELSGHLWKRPALGIRHSSKRSCARSDSKKRPDRCPSAFIWTSISPRTLQPAFAGAA